MYPLLHDGDVVTYKKTLFPKLVENDLVLIKQKNKYITHRIVYITKTYAVTKGDSNTEADGKIKPSQILGKVVSVKRAGKSFDPEALYLMQSTLYFQEIVRIKSALEKKKIEYVFLKGLPVHLYYEKTHPRRMYADCDLLVERNKGVELSTLFRKHGYSMSSSSLWKDIPVLNKENVEISFYKKVNSYFIVFDIHTEVHFLLNQKNSLNSLYGIKKATRLTDLFLNKIVGTIINGERFYILPHNLEFLYLLLHFIRHGYRGAFRFSFIIVVLKRIMKSKNQMSSLRHVTYEFCLHDFIYPVFLLVNKYFKNIDLRDRFAAKGVKIPIYKRWYIEKYILSQDIFSDKERIGTGISRFIDAFVLSPYPWYRKLFVFLEPQVILTILWVLWKKLSMNRSLQKT